VKAKYSIKNNKTDESPVFFPTKNHRKANTSSIRNLRPMATIICKVLVSGSLFIPLKAMARIKKASRANTMERVVISLKSRFTSRFETTRNPAARIIISIIKRIKIYFPNIFKWVHFIKSLIAMYIAANTPRRERIIVKTGLLKPDNSSSLIPPQVVRPIIAII
jgi:hypothetical protein